MPALLSALHRAASRRSHVLLDLLGPKLWDVVLWDRLTMFMLVARSRLFSLIVALQISYVSYVQNGVEETLGFTNRDDTFSAGNMTLLITRILPQKIIQMGHMMIDHFISG